VVFFVALIFLARRKRRAFMLIYDNFFTIVLNFDNVFSDYWNVVMYNYSRRWDKNRLFLESDKEGDSAAKVPERPTPGRRHDYGTRSQADLMAAAPGAKRATKTGSSRILKVLRKNRN